MARENLIMLFEGTRQKAEGLKAAGKGVITVASTRGRGGAQSTAGGGAGPLAPYSSFLRSFLCDSSTCMVRIEPPQLEISTFIWLTAAWMSCPSCVSSHYVNRKLYMSLDHRGPKASRILLGVA